MTVAPLTAMVTTLPGGSTGPRMPTPSTGMGRYVWNGSDAGKRVLASLPAAPRATSAAG
jgi:hypothetical protein